MAGEYTVDDVAPAQGAPPKSDYSVDDVAGPDAANPPATASTPGYVGSRLVGGYLEGGRNLATAANLEMGQYPDATETGAMPNGQDTANKAIYGTANVPAPNKGAKFIGDLASSIGANPVGAVMAPGSTALASGLSTSAELAGLPPWLGVVAAPFFALLGKTAGVGAKIALPTVKDAARAVLSPSRAGAVNASRTLTAVDNSAVMPQPSAEDVANAASRVRAATADMTEGAAPASQVGEQIRTDLTGRQTRLKAEREAQTAPIAAARDASTEPVNTDPVVSLIADKLRTAAGPQAAAINGALSDLKYPSGAIRGQAGALAASRQAINARIGAAKAAGDNTTVKHLSDIRDALDAQVNAAVPEAGQFNSAYQAASEPLDVFTPGRSSVDAVPNVVARDNFGNLNGTPASEIPDAFLRGSATKEKLDQLVQAYGGNKAAAESALEQHLAEVARSAVREDGTLDPAKFAKVMQPYQKVLGPPTAPAPQPNIAQRAAIAFQKARAASDMTMPSDGDPARSFSSIAAEPAPTTLPAQRWNAGNVGAWFPNLKAKFATAQAAQNTLDTISAQHNLTSSIAGGSLRNSEGLVTGKSFGDWLKANKAQLAQAQSPAAVTRLQQLASAVSKASNTTTEAMMTEVVPTAVGMATGGVEGGILGGMMHKIASTAYKPFAARYNEAFSSAIERAALDPLYARQLVAQLPRGPYTAAEAARALSRAVATVPAKGTAVAITNGRSQPSSSQ